MRNRWYHVPLLHTADTGEKAAGWLELFYDLIFVAAFIQLGNGLANDISVTGALAFAAMFVPLWFAWTGFTYYSNRFTVDDFTHRILVFVQMFAVGGMAIYAPDVLSGRPHAFAIAYILAQLMVALLYLRAWRQMEEARDFSLYWGMVFFVGAVLWGISLLFPAPWCYLFWAAGILAIMSAPFSTTSRALMERYPIDQEHLSERYGLLTIIVLGESFVKVLSSIDVHAPEFGVHVLGQASLTLLITCSLWWIYFDDVAGSRLKQKPLAALTWLFAHLPLQLGITGTGVAIKKAAHFEMGADYVSAKYRWLLCGALALVCFATALIDSVSERKEAELSDKARVNMRMTTGLVILLMAPVGGTMPPSLFLGIVTAMCFAQVIFDMMMAPLADDAHIHEHAHSIADLGRQAKAEGRTAPRVDLSKLDSVVRKGTPNALRRDLYFYLMEGSWFRVFALMLFLYLVINVFFAALYTLVPGSIIGGSTSFADAFYFSVQTMSTIGYGTLSPDNDYGNMLVTIEAAIGILGVALATGLMFAKASRPKASVMFSDPIVLTRRHGKPTLTLRVGNARGNQIVAANVHFTALMDEFTPEGHHMRRLHDLKLQRAHSPFFQMTWTVMHVIDEDSPLAHVDWSRPEEHIMSMVVILTGHDGTYGSTVHARHLYSPDDIRPGHRFVDVISQLPDGRMMIEYDKFHLTVLDPTDEEEPVEGEEPEIVEESEPEHVEA